MKGVILAGGKGTRLGFLTKVTNKHLLPVYDKPMIFYPLQTLVNAGITEILVVTGGQFAGHFIGVLKNGEELGLKHLEYAYQEGEGGISDALKLAEHFADGQNLAVILGDNCTDANIKEEVESFSSGAKIFLKEVPDPERFGVPTLDEKGNVVAITEKPSMPASTFAVTGLYLYDHTVFDRIRKLKPSARNELEVTDLNNSYLKDGQLSWGKLEGYWQDTGNPEALFKASSEWRNKHFANLGKERE